MDSVSTTPNPDFVIKANEEERKKFYNDLFHTEKQESKPIKSAILSIVPVHNTRFIPKAVHLDLPTPLSELYCSRNRTLTQEQLEAKCEEAFTHIQISLP